MKILLTLMVTLILITTFALAETLPTMSNADGYKWVEYSPVEKLNLVHSILDAYKITYDRIPVMKAVDRFYTSAIEDEQGEAKLKDSLATPVFVLIAQSFNRTIEVVKQGGL